MNRSAAPFTSRAWHWEVNPVRLCELSRAVKPDIKLGICGEHGGDPESVKFCHRAGLDYVSCSPYRVQVARIAAGQAALEASATGRQDV